MMATFSSNAPMANCQNVGALANRSTGILHVKILLTVEAHWCKKNKNCKNVFQMEKKVFFYKSSWKRMNITGRGTVQSVSSC